MPRISTKPQNTKVNPVIEERFTANEKRSSRMSGIRSAWKAVKEFLSSRQARMIIGVLLLLFAVMAVLSFLSFLFTGAADQSVISLSRGEQWTNREEIRNLLGLPGARLANFMVESSFGMESGIVGIHPSLRSNDDSNDDLVGGYEPQRTDCRRGFVRRYRALLHLISRV